MAVKYYILSFFCSISLFSYSQSVQRSSIQSAAGDFSDAGLMQLQSNVGELMSVSFFGSQGVLTQGFIQPELLSVSISDHKVENITGKVFPNPVLGKLYLEFRQINFSDISISIYDILGKQHICEIMPTKIEGRELIELNFENLNAGIYFVCINSSLIHFNQTYKISKI
jgi:hypothetical protein